MLDERNLALIAMSKTSNVCYMADMDSYELIFINEVGKKLFGFKDDEYMGQKCYAALNGHSEVCSFCTNKYLVPGVDYKWENFNEVVKLHYALTDTMFEADGKNIRLEIAVDIHDAKSKLINLESQLTLEETLVRCAQTLSEHVDIEVAISRLLTHVGEYYNADRAYTFEIKVDGIHMDNTYEWSRGDIEPQKNNLQGVPVEFAADWFKRFETEGEFYITSLKEDVNFDSDAYKTLEPQGIDNLLAAPLKINNKIIGFLGVDNPKNNFPDTSLLRSVSLFLSNDLDKKQMLLNYERLASLDVFTGLYNRNKYIQTLKEISDDAPSSIGIVYLDVNGLKQINDDFGHEHGDKIILKVVELIKSLFPEYLFRVGGDEFVALYMKGDRTEFEEKVLELRNSASIETNINISLGSTWCSDSHDIFKQIAHADELMYIDKQDYYSNRLSNRKNYRANVAADLRNAIAADEFVVLLQPKIRLSDEKVVGAEALVRKKDGKGGLISPDKFISIYEAEGVIQYLDLAVLDIACQTLKKWRKDGHTLIQIAVNFSRVTILEYQIAKKVNKICQMHGIESKFIAIELTECISNISLENLNEVINDIKSYGFTISLDDFGTKYSNILTLSRIAFDEIKLDKSLIDDVAWNPAINAVVRHVIGMCNTFRHTKMVAEGIETREQLEALREVGDALAVGQGFYFSKPISIEEFLEYYLKHKVPD